MIPISDNSRFEGKDERSLEATTKGLPRSSDAPAGAAREAALLHAPSMVWLLAKKATGTLQFTLPDVKVVGPRPR